MLSLSLCLFKAGDSPAEEVLHCCWLWLGLSRHRVQRHPSVFPRVSLSKAAADGADWYRIQAQPSRSDRRHCHKVSLNNSLKQSISKKLSNQLLWQRWKDLHWRARLKVFGCLFNCYCFCPRDAPTGFLCFKVNVFMTAKFYLMQQKLQWGFGPEASSSVACVRHILYQESCSSALLNTMFGNPAFIR